MESPLSLPEYDPHAGCHISRACSDLVEIANSTGGDAKMMFNGQIVIAKPGTDPGALEELYHSELSRKHQEYLASQAGQEAQLMAEQMRRDCQAAEAAGILPFTVIDKSVWDKCVEANSGDDYGACTLRYAARWANLMETRYRGHPIDEIAERAGHDADLEGITGFMYGCAVSILSQVWKHGEALRTWHNRKYQIGNDGDRANDKGGTLNPALLSVG